MKVLKFGGSSLSTPSYVETVCNIIHKSMENSKIVVVVSALNGITNNLAELAKLAKDNSSSYKDLLNNISVQHFTTAQSLVKPEKQPALFEEIRILLEELDEVLKGVSLLKELSPGSMDLILSFGEILSAKILTEVIKGTGIHAEYMDARNIIVTDTRHGSAKVDIEASYSKIQRYFAEHKSLQIVTGFIASTKDNITTTLGRGGSDLTASILAAALDAEEIQLWKDTDGVMTTNPKKVKKAFPLSSLSYEEAMELSHFGAKVIYPPTIQPAYMKKIPIRILNTFNQDFSGTLITSGEYKGKTQKKITGITSIEDISLLVVQGCGMIGVSGISARLFGTFAKEKISVILITQASSEHSICVAIEPIHAKRAKSIVEEEFKSEILDHMINRVFVENDLSIIAIVGENMKKTVGIAGKFFSALAKNGINIVAIAQGSSELNISVVISKDNLTKALNAVHQEFFLSETKTANLFVVGCTGNIGSRLLDQIKENYQKILKNLKLELKLVGIVNTKKMYFLEDGINYENYRKELEEHGETSNLDMFVDRMKKMNMPNSVFVDCTAIPDPVKHYCSALESSISVVTPNKNGAASSYLEYSKLKELATLYNTKYIYETNVGAGLPIINTLDDLVNSGDKILRFDGILSGTLSFIFTSFTGDRKFSDVVMEAKEKGFTEPDPRMDLSGLDFARKILILAREIGAKLELKDVIIEPFIPDTCFKADSVDSFFEELKKHDDYFEKMRKEAEGRNEKLKCIGTYSKGSCKISLQSIGTDHPFYQLKGSDNIVSFETDRYNVTPVVIKGPGAGSDVTSAGVLADIIRSFT
ncbi:MAG: bifunctional aspartate kinase/homoserine dehydrogenase I [Proteobacteria bacterium]|nr:bifunctional aspartate kinase/homoserine dehydrogenase I [Pseudomonadota bacterium]